MRTFRDVGQMILENSTAGLENRLSAFDVAVFRELLALAIVSVTPRNLSGLRNNIIK